MAIAIQMIVDITLVTRLSRIANWISGLARLVARAGNGEYKIRPRMMTLIARKTIYVSVR